MSKITWGHFFTNFPKIWNHDQIPEFWDRALYVRFILLNFFLNFFLAIAHDKEYIKDHILSNVILYHHMELLHSLIVAVFQMVLTQYF